MLKKKIEDFEILGTKRTIRIVPSYETWMIFRGSTLSTEGGA